MKPTASEQRIEARLYVTDEFEIPPAIMWIDDSVVASMGNFSALVGKSKSKKTFAVSAIVAAALSGQESLKFRAILPKEKQNILYVDTEQSKRHCLDVLQRILVLANIPLDCQPKTFEFLSLRKFSTSDRLDIIKEAITKTEKLGLVVIDGIRDLVVDINNATDSTNLITDFMRWTDEFNLHIITVLHTNKIDSNTRGHLGTEVNNKAESVLQIKIDAYFKYISHIEPMLMRDKEFSSYPFEINDQSLPQLVKDYQILKSEKLIKSTIDTIPDEQHREFLKETFRSIQVLRNKELIPAIMEAYECGKSKATLLLKVFQEKEMIRQDDRKTYRYQTDTE
jgi:hypothetical protein